MLSPIIGQHSQIQKNTLLCSIAKIWTNSLLSDGVTIIRDCFETPKKAQYIFKTNHLSGHIYNTLL